MADNKRRQKKDKLEREPIQDIVPENIYRSRHFQNSLKYFKFNPPPKKKEK